MDKPEDGKDAEFTYNPGDGPSAYTSQDVITEVSPKEDEPLVNWSSVNSYSHSKTTSWYFIVILITVGISSIIYLFTKDRITTGVILVCGILLSVYGGKKPKTVDYQLTRSGFTVNGKYYQFSNFRSFSVIHQEIGSSVILTPLKRFLPYSYIYFDKDLEDQISTALADVLPFEAHRKDLVEDFLRKIGF
jgi:hypothetical protein